MEKSRITVQITFSYQGETYTPSAIIDLDRYQQKNESMPQFSQLVARVNQIDPYSYQYEVMEMGQYRFSDPQGLAKDFCSNDYFDMAGFSERWEQHYVDSQLADIAREYLQLENLERNKSLQAALYQAFELGRKR